MISRLFSFLTFKNALYPYEIFLITEVIKKISGDAGERLKRQRDHLNHVQRHRSDKEVNLYRMENGKAAFSEDLIFKEAPDEECLARLRLSHIKEAVKVSELDCEIWMAGGRLFSLEFNKPPKKFFSECKHRECNIEILHVGLSNYFNG